MTIEQELGGVVARAVSAALGVEVGDPQVRPSANEQFGDYQTTVAMSLAKQVGRPPRDIAGDVVGALDAPGILRSAEIAGPGFVNLHLTDDALTERLERAAGGERAGIPEQEPRRRVIVDYSAPNVAKEMHVGHLRSTIIGDALVRTQRFLGHEVIPQNHIGDWGTPFGMLLEELSERGGDVDLSDLNAFYRGVRERFDSDSDFMERARLRVVKLQSGDPETRRLWDQLVAESERHFQRVYELVGVGLTGDDTMGESRYNDFLADTVDELKQKGIAREDQGAWIVTPEGFTGRDGGPAVLIVQKSDGGFTYAATDLAAIRYRLRDLDANEALYVVGQPQTMHFAMIFQTAREAGWLTDEHHAEHVAFGSVLGEDGKMLRTRSGDPIKLIDLLEEAVDRAAKLVEDADPDVARAVGIGSLKYADLVNDRERDYTFSWDRMLSLDGNTGVYLQYAVARIRSMLDKAGEQPDTRPGDFTQPAERALALRIVGFPTALAKAVEQSKPHILARALYDLAQAFSSFYEKCPVLRADDDESRALRLLLSRATERTLVTGLDLLGIETPQRL